MKLFTRTFFLSALIICLSGSLWAQTTGDYQTNNATPFNWNATASWQRWNGSGWISNPAEGYPGQNASGISGTVTILNGHTVTLNVSPAQNIGNFVIASGGTLTGGNFTLKVAGDFTNNGGTFTPSTSTITFTGAIAQAINGTLPTQTFNNIIINKSSGAVNIGGSTTALSVNTFTQTLGDFNAPATLSTAGTVTLTAGTFTAGANLNIGGTTAALSK